MRLLLFPAQLNAIYYFTGLADFDLNSTGSVEY